MKEFIWLNYNLKVKKIYGDCFFLNNEKIKIVKLKNKDKNIEDIEKLFLLSNELYYKKIHVNTFILNKKGKCYTNKNNECIVLMKIIALSYDLVINKGYDKVLHHFLNDRTKTLDAIYRGYEQRTKKYVLLEYNYEEEMCL